MIGRGGNVETGRAGFRTSGAVTGSVPVGRWFVLRTKPRQEAVCVEELVKKGIPFLCPMTREYRFRRRRQEVVPLFPGYVFVHFPWPEGYHDVRYLRGVSDLVRFGDHDPPSLDGDLIEYLDERMDADGVIDTSPDLKEGDRVRFLSEPLRGLVGTILRTEKPQGRVHVLMELLYQATVEVEAYQVQPL